MTDRFSTYNGYMNPRAVLGSWKKFRNKEISGIRSSLTGTATGAAV